MIIALDFHKANCRCGPCRQRRHARCDGSGTHKHCSAEGVHEHCVCMLPMAVGSNMCQLCEAEGLVALDVDEVEWDGKTYPSWRNHRLGVRDPESYLLLADALAIK